MSSGPILDAKIVELLGIGEKPNNDGWIFDGSRSFHVSRYPYSSSIELAFELVEKYKEEFNFVGPCPEGWNAVFIDWDDDLEEAVETYGAVGDTPAEAICKAFVYFMENKE